MAKKPAKKSAKKAAKKADAKAESKKAEKKSAKKGAAQAAKKADKKAAKKPAKKSSKKTHTKVSTGKGHTPAELGQILVDHVNSGGDDNALWKNHFHKNFVSIEGTGDAYHGTKAVRKKCDDWMDQHIIHSAKASALFAGATGFGVLFDMDVEIKASGQRFPMREIGVYTVKNGKVVQEEFMYPPMN